jgi:hypothetical protein
LAFFTPDEAAALARGTVRVGTLVDFEFGGVPPDGGPVYLWNGFGTRVFAGKTYWGAGDLGAIDGLEEARNPVSHQVTFSLSGVPDSPADLLAKALEATDIVQGRLAIVSLQLFDGAWQPSFGPIPIYFGIMQPPRVELQPATETQGAQRTLSLPTENLFFGRGRPAAGRYTDREQQMRFPGDRFLEYTAMLVNQTLNWPDY